MEIHLFSSRTPVESLDNLFFEIVFQIGTNYQSPSLPPVINMKSKMDPLWIKAAHHALLKKCYTPILLPGKY